MATTKQPATRQKTQFGKQQAAPAAPPAPAPPVEETIGDLNQLLADEYLADRVYDALLERGEAAKASEITLEINNPRLSFPLVRRALGDASRFLSADRRWDITARYLDRSRPTERNLEEVLRAAGRPLSTAQLATELSAIYRRPSDVYLGLVAKVTQARDRYFRTVRNEVGLAAWLPLVDADEDEDVLFDNDLTPARVAPYVRAAEGAVWTPATYAEATRRIVEALGGRPVPHRVLGVLAWRVLGAKYDPLQHLLACLGDAGLVWLSGRNGGRWITRARADALEDLLVERAAGMGADEPDDTVPPPVPVEAAAPAPPAEPAEEEEATTTPVAPLNPPLEIKESDLAALVRILADRGAAVDVAELLALQYEVVPGDASFREDMATLEARLRADERFLYVGAGRFREPNSLPQFVYSLPEFLSFPDLQFVSLDGEFMDEEIQDEGFVGTLRSDVLSPLAQDAGDDEKHYTGAPTPDEPIRLVLKAHHKEIGTFPLCQVPDHFFPGDAPLVEVVIRDATGQAHDVIVNNDLRLAFNLFGLYEALPADSGAVFLLHRTARPFEFRFEPLDETDGQVYVSPARHGELLGLREQADESGDIATFDIACEILAHHVKGLDFVQTITEVNIVRRVTRRKLASILSNYYCFVQKAGQSLWRFDAKKRDLGTDRAKRKYIKR